MKISILGYGTFGSAIGSYLSKRGHIIYKEEIKDAEVVIMAVPSFVVSEVLLKHKSEITNQKIIICSKGFDKEGELISGTLDKEFFNNKIYFLYGPTLAEGLNNGELSAMVLAGGEGKEELKNEIESDILHIELSDDVIGVQVGEALKNVVAIFVGIIEGAGYGQNTRAFIFTKGIQEIRNFGVVLGANPDTFLGLTCAGDLTMISRNRTLGIEFGKGSSLEEITEKMNYSPEGLTTLKNAIMIAKKYSIEIPFMNILHGILFESAPIADAIKKIK